jgi:hypothetical protein
MMTRAIAVASISAMLASSPAPARADVVLDWNAIMLATLTGQNPFAQARFAAITHLAVFEAVNAVTGDYRPYLGTITAPTGASPQAAAVAAAHRVLRTYFPASAANLDAARAASLAAIPDGRAKTDGIMVGEAAAAAMIGLRANDGAAPPQFHLPPTMDPGEWQLTPGCPPAGGILRHWGNVMPFGVERVDRFRSAPPPPLTGNKYARDFNEVKRVGGMNSMERPQDRADVARFYAVVSAVGAWNPAVSQVAAARGTSLSSNARALALLNMAITDGLVASMETKYHYAFWRPETAIRAGEMDGNAKTHADFGFVPFITTPCFPGHGSAHAAAGYAARRIAERILGSGPHSITLSSPAVSGVTLHYTSFEDITDDIDDARVYGGIHFRFEQRAGARQGRRIGAYVLHHNLAPGRQKD